MAFSLFPFIANTYLFMVQARGIMLKENVKTIGHMIDPVPREQGHWSRGTKSRQKT